VCMAGCKSSTRLSLRTMSTSTAADMTSVNAAGKSQRKRPKDAVTTLDEVSLGARSNSADVPTKIGSAAEPKPDRRERRLTGAMASLQELSELKEKQRLAALQKKLLPYDGHCWCCLMADCTHEPGSDECPQCETTTPDMSDFRESSCPDFAQGGEMRLYGLSTHGATRLMESEDVHCFAVCHQRMLLIVAFKLRIVTFDLTSLDSLHSLELAAEDQDADDGAYNMQVVGDQLFVAFPDLDMITSHDVVTLHMNARLGTTHLRRPTDVAGCDGVLLITEMEANALAICSMTGERLRTVCFEPVFEAIKPTSVTVIEQASGPSLMAVITQNWLLVLTLDGKVRQRVPARTRFQCARATEQRLLVSDIDAHIVHEFRFE
jgi:hypothetical protein